LERGQEGDLRLVPLAVAGIAEKGADALLSNLLVVDSGDGQTLKQAGFPQKLARMLLADETLGQVLPVVKFYCRRPVFDQDFTLCGPGYNLDSGILVHGPAITPVLHEPSDDPAARAIDRLPPWTRKLLAEFCWKSQADLVNAVAYLLQGVLINHFVNCTRPLAIVDGNQPSIGKTSVAQVIGCILDGVIPKPIGLSGDEELAKRLGAEIRSSRSSMIFLDNLRGRLVSQVIEANALAPVVAFRLLGQSVTIERSNEFMWVITSNGTEASDDLTSRSLPIRLFYEGDPKKREFTVRLVDYALDHRLEILGELAGMVLRWLQCGKPAGHHQHRCEHWASVIGGILDVAGLGQFFLANVDEATAEMDQGLHDLMALAEHTVKRPDCQDLLCTDSGRHTSAGRLPANWVSIFEQARVLQDKLAGANDHSRNTAIGLFLGAKIDRTITVETEDQTLELTLRKRSARSNRKSYYFDVKVLEKNDTVAALGTEDPDRQVPLESTGSASSDRTDGQTAVAVQLPACPTPAHDAAEPPAGGGPGATDLEWC
jgi:hypothetical protein